MITPQSPSQAILDAWLGGITASEFTQKLVRDKQYTLERALMISMAYHMLDEKLAKARVKFIQRRSI